MKTAELVGHALNYAVARALGKRPHIFTYHLSGLSYLSDEHNYSKDWAQGGPIIERDGIDITNICPGTWRASTPGLWFNGPTPLIAAMRCYVASKLGDSVEIPAALL